MEVIVRWDLVAASAAGVAIAGLILLWPRPTLICLGLVSLLLGILGVVWLNSVSGPALAAIMGGIGLIAFGGFVGSVETILTELRGMRSDAAGRRPEPEETHKTVETRLGHENAKPDGRIEPRL